MMAEIENSHKPSEEFSHTPVKLRDFGIEIGDRWLLENVNLEFPAGKLSVIVGASGSGKSSLLKVLAGLIDNESALQVAGSVETQQDDKPGHVGLVFQNFALFDEFSPLDNIRIALDHQPTASRTSKKRSLNASQWLDALHVPAKGHVSGFSGGQKQRLAIARTLAGHPDILLYDEPTSGLDAWAAQRVAHLIQETQQKFGITSIVVTHDYASWLGVADHVFILEPAQRTLVELQTRSADEVASRIEAGLVKKSDEIVERNEKLSTKELIHVGLWNPLETLGRLTASFMSLPVHLVPIWKNPAWGGRFLAHYASLVAGASAWFYIGVAGVIVGFVATYFTFRYLPYQLYTKPLLMEELLASIGFALYRILVPVLATILIAARCGAAVAADVGGKKYGGQIDALKTLGISPARYLLTPILLAFLVGTPLLTQFAFWIAKVTSLVAFNATHSQLGPYYWDFHFHRRLVVGEQWLYDGFGWVALKSLLCGLMVGWVAYLCGTKPKSSSRDVSRAITSTVLWATLAVLIVHFCVAFWEFDAPG
jgi:ABC-type transporter Mla maintaining outer membrane lipid asymmetry ATPase subunit MlaF/ABC-type transporter Mla maintaining outer membrane lipid asymmetry permease subunit MlaE